MTDNIGITRDQTCKDSGSGGTRPDALASTRPIDRSFWADAIDEMLSWKRSPSILDAQDQPDEEVLDTAIDYAVDQLEEEACYAAPDSIVPSGGGSITMEWNDGPFTVIVEFVGLGEANYTQLHHGRVREKQKLFRNPSSRKLELRG